MTSPKETDAAEPRLGPPGAGLPKGELAVARIIFHGNRLVTSRELAARNFEEQKENILRIVSALDELEGGRRVLIRRLPGLEDSSRYWSVYMTLDHLRIVNEGIAGTIAALLDGRTPLRPASTAAVKPSEQVTARVIPEFVKSCAKLKSCASAAASLKTSIQFAHPWFGFLNAEGWHFMAGFHMKLHRRQIERILECRTGG